MPTPRATPTCRRAATAAIARCRSRSRCGTASPRNRLDGTAELLLRANQRLARFSLDLVGLAASGVRVDGRTGGLPPGAGQAAHHPATAHRARRRVPRRRRVRRRPEAAAHPVVGRDRLGGARRRRAGRVAAVGGADLVPVQRPPVRQGELPHPLRDGCRLHRRRQRRARGPPRHQRAGGVGLRPARAHGELPRDAADRPVREAVAPASTARRPRCTSHVRWSAACRRLRPAAAHARGLRDRVRARTRSSATPSS